MNDTLPTTVDCECGRITGERCSWSGPRAETVIVEWMPTYLRAAHEAANNRGSYPHNGAERLRVSRECADLVCDDDWTTRVSGGGGAR